MDWISDPNAWIGFLTLAGLEIVLGIDNIVFISILVGKLEKASTSFSCERATSASSRGSSPGRHARCSALRSVAVSRFVYA